MITMADLARKYANVSENSATCDVGLCVTCGVRERRRYPSRVGSYCIECHAEYVRKWRKAHPLNDEQRRKDIARSYAGVYKRRGKLKPKPCERCGLEKAEMHHHDYSKPLEVEWLCRPCHMAMHQAEIAA